MGANAGAREWRRLRTPSGRGDVIKTDRPRVAGEIVERRAARGGTRSLGLGLRFDLDDVVGGGLLLAGGGDADVAGFGAEGG